SQQKRNKQRDSLHKASHLISHTLVERTVVIGDLSQRQMAMQEHNEHNKQRNKQLNRAVFNDWGLYDWGLYDWGLYPFVQMLRYKCVLFGKELAILDERDASKTCSSCGHKQVMPLYKRTYRCPNTDCRLVMDRDENSAVNILKRYLARLGPHTGDPVRCADVFTATDHVNTFEPM
ncbi:MAG TPA: transposase, partial [Ktedonobacteraceae bacterium]|nr:transposase [Ktedonobacteraceae bacterium]